MSTILLPNTHVKSIEKPFIYLAGPIQGAPQWQALAMKTLFEWESDLIIASPRRLEIVGAGSLESYVVQGDDTFSRQRLWERHYMDLAARKGALLFWLPGEHEHRCSKAYGANTRLELGEWMTRLGLDRSLRVCFGSDGNFSELDVIRCDLEQHASGTVVHNTLSELCYAALQTAHS